jgi:hypothetical protein
MNGKEGEGAAKQLKTINPETEEVLNTYEIMVPVIYA